MLGNREAGVLARTFRDRMTVYRRHPERDPETQATVEKEYIVYEDIICGLSQGSNNVPERQEFHSETKRDSTIFTAPGVELLDNDRAVITTEAGQQFTGTTGKTFMYISHGETPFTVERLT
ncbi:MAG: hypothetical protein OSJ71_17175 [Acetatifactor sp.]|nr:hypothetical protein [Acetatifactor sp.]